MRTRETLCIKIGVVCPHCGKTDICKSGKTAKSGNVSDVALKR